LNQLPPHIKGVARPKDFPAGQCCGPAGIESALMAG
jgi:hypothetical protein